MSDRWSAARKLAFSKRIKGILRDGAGNAAWQELDQPRIPEPPLKLRLTREDVLSARHVDLLVAVVQRRPGRR